MKKVIMIALVFVLLLSFGVFSTNAYAQNSEEGKVPYLTLISPDGDEEWTRGTVHPIFWQSEGIEKVVIQLYKGNELVSSLAEEPIDVQGNLDYFVWEIPKDLKPGNDYRVKVYSVSDNETLELVDFSRGPFRIGDNISQRISFISPITGDKWAKGEPQTIIWEYDGDIKEVYLVLYPYRLITGPIKNKGYFIWDVPANLKSGEYYVWIRAVENRACDVGKYFVIGSLNEFSVRERNPNINVLNPVQKEVLVPGKTYDIFWESVRTKKVSISLYQGEEYICSIAGPIESSGQFTWLVPKGLEPADNYRIRIFDWDSGWYPAYSGCFIIAK